MPVPVPVPVLVLVLVLVPLEQRPNLYWKQFERRPTGCPVCPMYWEPVDLPQVQVQV